MTHTSADLTPISTTVEQMSLLSTNDTYGKENQSTSCAEETKRHVENNIGEPDETMPGLPNEIMGLIFSFLTNSQSTLHACTLVNKECYDLANPILWKSPDILDYDMARRFRDCMIGMHHQRRHILGRLIHDVRLIYLTWSRRKLSQLLPHMPNLQHLTLANCDNPKAIQQLPPLTSLKLDNVKVSDDVIDTIAQLPLEKLDWSLKSPLNPAWLTRLAQCPLRRLSIDYDILMGQFHPIELYGLLQQEGALDFDELTTPFNSFFANPATFPQLTFLSVRRCTDVYDAMLVAFFNNHPLLEQLHLSEQIIVTDTTLDAMGSLSRLTHASLTHLGNITSPAVRRLINACPLVYLDVSGCKQLVDADFPELGWETIGVWDSCQLDKIRHHQW